MLWRLVVSPALKGALGNLRAEIERDMKLMRCRSVDQLSRDHSRFRRATASRDG